MQCDPAIPSKVHKLKGHFFAGILHPILATFGPIFSFFFFEFVKKWFRLYFTCRPYFFLRANFCQTLGLFGNKFHILESAFFFRKCAPTPIGGGWMLLAGRGREGIFDPLGEGLVLGGHCCSTPPLPGAYLSESTFHVAFGCLLTVSMCLFSTAETFPGQVFY